MVAVKEASHVSRQALNPLTGPLMKTPTINALKLLCLSALLACAFGAHAASFDCAKAKGDVERMVCGDAQTSALDSKLQQTYTEVLAATDTYGRKELAREQRNWIRYTRGICQDTSCLRKSYLGRIAILAKNDKDIENDRSCARPNGYQGDAAECGVSLEVYRDPNDNIDSFNRSLALYKQPGHIIGCSRLIVEGSGTLIGRGPGNQNFGGYCILQHGTWRIDVMICNDTMIGNFHMQTTNPSDHTAGRLLDFTYRHCYEGN